MLAITVDTLQDVVDAGDGVTSLREAIFAANTANGEDTIDFAPSLTANGPVTILLTQGELAITQSLTIEGPGSSLLTIDASGNDPTPELENADGSRIFFIDDGVYSQVSDVNITGLHFTGGDMKGAGGAIYSREKLTASDIVVSENYADIGGGLSLSGRGTSITHSWIVDNAAESGGGLHLLADGTTLIEDVVINGNIARAPAPALTVRGGGILVSAWGGDVVIRRSTISNNAAEHGGGIANDDFFTLDDLHLRVEESAIEGNSSTYGGGGISFLGEPLPPSVEWKLDVVSSVIRQNFAGGSGGGLITNGNVSVDRSTIVNNSAVGDGGGLSLSVDTNESVSITNSTFANNQGRNGGALHIFGSIPSGTVQILGSTFSGNSAALHGGAIYRSGNYDWLHVTGSTITQNRAGAAEGIAGAGGGIHSSGSLAKFALEHVILADNSDDSEVESNLFGSSPQLADISHSLIGYIDAATIAEAPLGSPDANGNLIGGPMNGVIDPLLGPLANNGGATWTHALLIGSPAIDNGDPVAVAGANGVPEFDQRGEPWSRVVGGRIDIGAVEAQPNPLLGDYNFNGVVDAADYSVWRDMLGSTTDLRADGSGATVGVPDGVVDQRDYAFWKLSFGNVAGSGGGAASIAPVEPLAVVVEQVAEDVSSTSNAAGERSLASFGIAGDSIDASPQQRSSPANLQMRTAITNEIDGGLMAWLLQSRTRSDSPAASAESDPASTSEMSDIREIDAFDSAFASIGFLARRRGL